MFPGSRASPTTIFFMQNAKHHHFFFWDSVPKLAQFTSAIRFRFQITENFSRKKAGAPFLNGNERASSPCLLQIRHLSFAFLECTRVSQTSIVSVQGRPGINSIGFAVSSLRSRSEYIKFTLNTS